ncbi:MAG: serine hydrolase domain-containing protein [Dehalococcoidia bacterium]
MPVQQDHGQTISRRSLLRSTAAMAAAGATAIGSPLVSSVARAGTPARPAQTADPDFVALDQQIQNAMIAMQVPGVAVGVILGDRTYAQGYGVANVNLALPVDTDTLFQVGSVSKTYTATAVMRLVEEGTLSLDTPVRTYLPDLRLADESVAAAVSLRHLLNHTSDFFGDTLGAPNRNDDALATFVGQLYRLPQLAPLGYAFNYSNAAVMLAGRVVEVVSGQGFEDEVTGSVLAPLNMTHSFYFADQAISYGAAAGHTLKDGKAVVNPDWALPRQANPAGGLVSSVTDQLQWLRFHLGQLPDSAQVLSAGSLTEMQTRRSPGAAVGFSEVTGVGVSWLFERIGGADLIMHDGATLGQHAQIVFSPALGFGLVLLTNAAHGAALIAVISSWVLDHFLGLSDPPLQAIDLTPDQLAPYEGRFAGFETPGASALQVQVQGTGLLLSALDKDGTSIGRPAPLAFYANDYLFITAGNAPRIRFNFVRSDDGSVGWLNYLGRLLPRLT